MANAVANLNNGNYLFLVDRCTFTLIKHPTLFVLTFIQI